MQFHGILIDAFPDEFWDWYAISHNPDITMDYINTKPNMTMEIIKANEDLSRFGNNAKWNWDKISRNSSITMNDIEMNMNKPWNWSQVSCNPNITIQINHGIGNIFHLIQLLHLILYANIQINHGSIIIYQVIHIYLEIG